MTEQLQQSIQYIKGVGPGRADDFARLGIHTVQDLLFTFPRDLTDRSGFSTISSLSDDGEIVLVACVNEFKERRPRGGKLRSIVNAVLDDGTGMMDAVWFNAPWVVDSLEAGESYLFYGKVKFAAGRAKMEHPQFERWKLESENGSLNAGRIVPVYPCTGKLNQKVWRKVMDYALENFLGYLPELYPPDFLVAHGLCDRQDAVRAMHFPKDSEERSVARQRLAYDESLLMQLAISSRRRAFLDELPGRSFKVAPELDRRIRKLFPFRFTRAQDGAIAEIVEDMRKPLPMHRLLQGDVGSGKTAVAFYAMLVAVASGTQVCLMAPTGLLARQHYTNLCTFLESGGRNRVKVRLLVGGMKKAESELVKTGLATGAVDVLVATHSAFSDDVQFRDLGLVIIDEQHKFGVNQRAALMGKGTRPDTLVMTATPIPRSLALTVYGDLDVSVIGELPPGRKPVITKLAGNHKEPLVWDFVCRELSRGSQVYVVSPLLEESEVLDVKSATEAFEELRHNELKSYRVGLAHGKMGREDQQQVMTDFKEHKIDVLVSTVVIEVGVDVPNANVMVVLHAERFGLAQLHQLRGRVGRGGDQGYFVMLSQAKGEVAQERLGALCATCDGFKIAEEDLRLRGPGEFLGVRQHGLPELKLVDIVEDYQMLCEARKDAADLLPELSAPRFKNLREELVRLFERYGKHSG